MGVAVPAQFVSTNDLIPTKNSLATLFAFMDPNTGGLPYCGPPLCTIGDVATAGLASDTYHEWALIGVHTYVLYTGDMEFLQDLWANYVSVNFRHVQYTELSSRLDKSRSVPRK